MSTGPNEKKEQFSKWFSDEHVLVHLDARRSGVEVPEEFKDDHSLTLKLSAQFQGPTDFDDERIVALLKFHGEYSRCVMPWPAIWGMTSTGGEQRIWSEELPREVITHLAVNKIREIGSRILGRDKGEEPTKSEPPKSEPLRAEPQRAEALREVPARESSGDEKPERRKPMLRRIK